MCTRNVIGILLFCQILGIVAPDILLAQCMVVNYTVTGQIFQKDMIPSDNTLILVFLDDESHGCSGRTSETGSYEVKNCRYNTFRQTSFVKWHVCDRIPTSITIITHGENEIPLRIKFDAKQVTVTDKERLFNVPPIVLE